MAKTVQKENAAPGDELPCHPKNILHTDQEIAGRGAYKTTTLVIWYVEDDRHE